MVIEHTATRAGKLLSFLRRELGLSYQLTKRLKYRHGYRVNGELARTNHMLRPGDLITVTIEEDVPEFDAEDGPLSILYEDEAILALDKPAGIIMHPTFNRIEGTLANSILGHYTRTGQKSAVHFVSRLDRDTFGVVLVAKNAHIHAVLCDAMQSGGMQKTYHAAVFGCPAQPRGEIRLPIARLSPTSLLRCVREDGKDALTLYEVLDTAGECGLLRLSPQTGRTHQLRVHCAHEGFPILGDVQYGTEASLAFSKRHGYTGQQLCAASLVFSHPLEGREMVIESGMAALRLPGRA